MQLRNEARHAFGGRARARRGVLRGVGTGARVQLARHTTGRYPLDRARYSEGRSVRPQIALQKSGVRDDATGITS